MKDSKNIIILFALNNSGHHTAAKAIQRAYEILYPNKRVIVLNIFESLSPMAEKIISLLYRLSSYTFPLAWGLLYNNIAIYKLCRPLGNYVTKLSARKLKMVFEKTQPACIICTQAIAVGIAGYLKGKYNYASEIVAVITDYFPNIYWVNRHVTSYVVASSEMIESLSKLGIAKNRIVPLGIPVHPVFSHFDTASNNNISLPRVLILGGGRGWGDIVNIIRQLDGVGYEFRVTVICGTNLKLLRYLRLGQGKFKKTIYAFGQVGPEKIKSFLNSSSLLISKAGGLTIAESLVCGVPMVIVNSVFGQEAKNRSFLIDNKAAVEARISTIADTVKNLLFIDPVSLERLKNNASGLARPLASFEIAKFVNSLYN